MAKSVKMKKKTSFDSAQLKRNILMEGDKNWWNQECPDDESNQLCNKSLFAGKY